MYTINQLTQLRVQAWLAKPREGDPKRKLADGGGLYLVRLPSGSASWQLRYRLAGREQTYSIGPQAEVSLAEARAERARVRALLRDGKDPLQVRAVARATELASAGEVLSDTLYAWLGKQRAEWGDYHYDKSKKALERHILPALGKLPVRDITPAMIAEVIDRIQRKSKRETAAKILRHVRAVFRYAAATGQRADNPAEAVVEILQKPDPVRHRAAVTTAEEARWVLRTLEHAGLSERVLACHQLIAFTAVRIANATAARWEEFDLAAGMWVIPRGKMKMQDRAHDHRAPLSAPILEKLRAWREAAGSPDEGHLFPGSQGRGFISREAVEKAIRESKVAGRHTCHGWRATFSTLAKDHGFENQVVDLALDHVHDSEVARAYDRGERLEKRVALMVWWGETLAAQ